MKTPEPIVVALDRLLAELRVGPVVNLRAVSCLLDLHGR